MILITHDLGVVAGVADRVLVMYAGRAAEIGGVDEVFAEPGMPYTAGLLASLPSLDHRSERLPAIPGTPPTGLGYGPGCAFAPRCPLAAEPCAVQPALTDIGAGARRGLSLRRPKAGGLTATALQPPVARDAQEGNGADDHAADDRRADDSGTRTTVAPTTGHQRQSPRRQAPDDSPPTTVAVVLSVTNLSKHFQVRGPSSAR